MSTVQDVRDTVSTLRKKAFDTKGAPLVMYVFQQKIDALMKQLSVDIGVMPKDAPPLNEIILSSTAEDIFTDLKAFGETNFKT